MAYLGEDIKKLGFGLMRLPMDGDKIDIEQVKQMVDKFMEAGFTYFDTAWAYAGSEDAIRQALVERYPRESYQLATKNAAWIDCKTKEDAQKQFDTSLKQTGAGYFDFYLLHNLGEHRTKSFDDFDMWTFVQEKKAQGLIDPSQETEFLVKSLISHNRTLFRFSSDSDFRSHQCKPEGQRGNDINNNKNSAAILCRQIRESPQIAQTDSASGSGEHKSDAARKAAPLLFCIFHFYIPLPFIHDK